MGLVGLLGRLVWLVSWLVPIWVPRRHPGRCARLPLCAFVLVAVAAAAAVVVAVAHD